MNRYSAAIISIGLALLSIDYFAFVAIAKDVPDNLVSNCGRFEQQDLISLNTIPDELTSEQPNLVAAERENSDTTQSSFWWAALQFDPFNGNLVQDWLMYPQKQQVNLVVNWRLWTLLDYFGRYRFVNQFGTVARKHGYNLNIFNQEDRCLASYKYNASSVPPKWELNLEKFGRDSLPIEPEIPQQYITPGL